MRGGAFSHSGRTARLGLKLLDLEPITLAIELPTIPLLYLLVALNINNNFCL